ncbi:anaerobic sulfatase maturase [Shewanella sp. D64]|uniref:anaerobic sulfatase maturase n=1 Tax=unclassified Shewanella TaxID=196818 RepID=UPI0022BA1B80|nr:MULTISPECIES: anaerobic sulfatase maturase [unclassified Shewanella]MEC4725055.1 anaerobic sulfatase maturase [Shewanella sp. D64]MEC4736956.1 anaerobic sulfatase maturase [Shewanella sp. E94]WBJ96550.1 anaerobic sulfatase maturase [Shewanella sp. MTB7]
MKSDIFTVMAKPVSDKCNLKCSYCFYLGTAEQLNHLPTNLMTDDVLRDFTQKYIEQSNTPTVSFVWQGGEPTLAGLDFFQKAVKFQQEFADGKTITNSLQTNGIALNRQWMTFLKEHHFLVGISIDGTQTAHDKYRISINGAPTYERVKQAIGLLNEFEIEYNALCTINSSNWNKGKTVYSNLKQMGVRFMQFIPIVVFDKKKKMAPFTVPQKGFGTFLVDVFNEWAKADINYTFIMNFESILSSYVNKHPLICFHSQQCGSPLVIESNGDVYSCDHFVTDQFRIGNIESQGFTDMIESDKHQQFQALRSITKECQRCEYLSLCHGGCPKHSMLGGSNYLCPSYKMLFKHTKEPVKIIINNLL